MKCLARPNFRQFLNPRTFSPRIAAEFCDAMVVPRGAGIAMNSRFVGGDAVVLGQPT
jgi:hypothetical protein